VPAIVSTKESTLLHLYAPLFSTI